MACTPSSNGSYSKQLKSSVCTGDSKSKILQNVAFRIELICDAFTMACSRLLCFAAAFLSVAQLTSSARSPQPVWSKLSDTAISAGIQRNNSVNRLTTAIGGSLMVYLPSENGCLVSDNNGAFAFQASYGPRPCSSQFTGDASITYYVSGSTWYLTGFSNDTNNVDGCNATLLQYEVSNAACGTSQWFQSSTHPDFAARGKRVGFETRFGQGPGVTLMGGRNATTGSPLYDVWVSCRNNGCTVNEWYPAQDLPLGCASIEGPDGFLAGFAPFTVNWDVYIACGGIFPNPFYTVYQLDSTALTWDVRQQFSWSSFGAPVNQTQIEELHSPGGELEHGAAGGSESRTARAGSSLAPGTPWNPRGSCIVAITGGPGYSTSNVSVTWDGMMWNAFTAPFASRTRFGYTRWPSGRLAVVGGIDQQGQYLEDAWAADYNLCCATDCDATGYCTVCSGHGTCTLYGSTLCTCDDGYSGPYCGVVVPSASPSPTPSPSRSPRSNGPTTGQVAGIASGAVVGGLLLGAAFVFVRRRGLRK